MQLAAILFMLLGGGALAAFVLVATAIARRESDRQDVLPPRRDAIAASLLVHVLMAGGAKRDEAQRLVRRGTGLISPATLGIDVTNWAESFARSGAAEQRMELLEAAVRLIAEQPGPVPLRQYAALLDLSFGLGFHSDALAKLRERYGFQYVDHASGRVSAGGVVSPPGQTRAECLAILGLEQVPSRQELTAVYRRLVRGHHPDRFHGADDTARTEAADRFMQITRAYEELLMTIRD